MNKFTENECLPNFELKFKFLENLRKPLTLKSTRKRIEEKNKMAETREESQTKVFTEENQTSAAKENQTGNNAEKSQASIPEKQTIVTYTDDELVCCKDNMVSENTKKSTSTSVRRLQSWFKEKHGKQINLDAISKQEAPQLLKHFFLEIRQTTKENKGKEYEPGTLQTYRNGLRRYFSGASMSTGSRQLRPRKIFRSFNDALHEEKGFEVKRSWQQTKCRSTS